MNVNLWYETCDLAYLLHVERKGNCNDFCERRKILLGISNSIFFLSLQSEDQKLQLYCCDFYKISRYVLQYCQNGVDIMCLFLGPTQTVCFVDHRIQKKRKMNCIAKLDFVILFFVVVLELSSTQMCLVTF